MFVVRTDMQRASAHVCVQAVCFCASMRLCLPRCPCQFWDRVAGTSGAYDSHVVEFPTLAALQTHCAASKKKE